MSHILLKSGTVLIHNESDEVTARLADVLIKDDLIHSIEDHIEAPENATVIDCHGGIVSPGFIDTHKHMWQSQLKGTHSDQILFDYYHSGNLASSHYEPEDVFWGVLSSAAESVDGGTTTVVDHAHMNYSADHSKEAIRATVGSGIRSVFCYCAQPRVTSWQPELKVDSNPVPGWVMETFRELAAKQPFGPRGRVRLGFAMDTMFVPEQVLQDTFAEARKHGAHLITSHATKVGMFDAPSTIAVLERGRLLGPDILLSHANATSGEELAHLEKAGVHLSSTPLSEMQMGHGHPVCLHPEFQPLASLGTDSNSICTSYIPAQMQIVLQATRSRRTEEQMRNGNSDATIGPTVNNVYNLGTILGARAIGLEREIGSIAVGKKADIVVFQGRSPAMLAVSERDPVASIVLFSSVADVQTVIIDGAIRKNDFSLRPLSVPKDLEGAEDDPSAGSTLLEWTDVVAEVSRSSKKIEEGRAKAGDQDAARDGLIKYFLGAMVEAGLMK
ncbi:hypothetical protein Micbo1qcDRAFT_186844 [Microdochium bolleyi]|uniref:Amidohydrolase-related domain-containing protein n=1 Tax=Microdochium bolleyi TaxID=196109 RepID=A0A136IIT6_9PEZI|nr:hypothetical protein Micbo1qcDRAFT_186844 [Microdochium bolleyi]